MSMDRVAALRVLHAEARRQNIGDEDYRDKLERLTGKRSAKDLTDAELFAACDDFRRPAAGGHPHQTKVKALFIAAFNLGLFETGTDAALDGFVKRQTGSERLAFLAAQDAHRVSEALKAMLAREGCMVPPSDDGGMIARRNLVAAQWAKLHTIGVVRIPAEEALMSWMRPKIVDAKMALSQLKRHELDRAAKALGVWLRRVLKEKPHVTD